MKIYNIYPNNKKKIFMIIINKHYNKKNSLKKKNIQI